MKTFKFYTFMMIAVALILNHSSCNQNKNKDSLEGNAIIIKYFDEKEREELKILLTIFDNIILKKSPENHKLENAYRDFFNKLISVKSADQHLPIYALDYSKFENLISPVLFNKIWLYKKDLYSKKVIISDEIDINFKGSYIKFLKEISSNDETLRIYYKDLLGSGSITAPGLVNKFVHNSKYLNLDKESVRLIIAIHYITLNNILIVNN